MWISLMPPSTSPTFSSPPAPALLRVRRPTPTAPALRRTAFSRSTRCLRSFRRSLPGRPLVVVVVEGEWIGYELVYDPPADDGGGRLRRTRVPPSGEAGGESGGGDSEGLDRPSSPTGVSSIDERGTSTGKLVEEDGRSSSGRPTDGRRSLTVPSELVLGLLPARRPATRSLSELRLFPLPLPRPRARVEPAPRLVEVVVDGRTDASDSVPASPSTSLHVPFPTPAG